MTPCPAKWGLYEMSGCGTRADTMNYALRTFPPTLPPIIYYYPHTFVHHILLIGMNLQHLYCNCGVFLIIKTTILSKIMPVIFFGNLILCRTWNVISKSLEYTVQKYQIVIDGRILQVSLHTV